MAACLEKQTCLIIIIQFYTRFTSFIFLFSSPLSHYPMHPTEGLFDFATYEILIKREDDIRFIHSGFLGLECTRQLKENSQTARLFQD